MDKKYQKPAMIAGGIVLVFALLFLFTNLGKNLGKFATISANIATNLAHPSHGDDRDLEMIDKTYIEEHTGCTSEVDEAELPKAFRPMKEHKHPPFSMGACQVCHAPKRSKPAAIVTETVWELCYKCHEPKLARNEEPKALDCNKCHSPHHADRKELLRDKVTEEACPVGEFLG